MTGFTGPACNVVRVRVEQKLSRTPSSICCGLYAFSRLHVFTSLFKNETAQNHRKTMLAGPVRRRWGDDPSRLRTLHCGGQRPAPTPSALHTG